MLTGLQAISMSNSNNILQGLSSSIFDNETKFEREQSFGKRLMVTAWAVEILAASIGLIIAAMMAWDAYNNSEIKTFSTAINALLGALPFLLIAIIEPTKIPLASGLYRVKSVGWKFLIALSLIGLTAVTFETLFTGLERQVTNITSTIKQGKTEITNKTEDVALINAWLEKNENLDITRQTDDLKKQLQDNISIFSKNKENTKAQYEDLKSNLTSRRDESNAQLLAIEVQKSEERKKRLSVFEQRVISAREKLDNKNNEKLRFENSSNFLVTDGSNDPQITILKDQIKEKELEIENVDSLLKSNERNQIIKAQIILNREPDGRLGERTLGGFESWRSDRNSEIQSLRNEISERLNFINQRALENKNESIEKLNLLTSELKALEVLLSSAETELNNAQIEENRGISETPAEALIRQDLKEMDQTQRRMDEDFKNSISELQSEHEVKQKNLEEEIVRVTADYTAIKKEIPNQKDMREVIEKEIADQRQKLRSKAEESQIYRFAQKWRGYEDILDVKEEDLTVVATIWFGSIALVCATVGTILALIANIMMDPDAFVEKEKLRRNNRFARSIRKLSVAFRKKLLIKPKIVTVEIPVEVEKVVEVEKIVEKIVEKPIREEVDKLVPEIIPIPIFVPNGGDPQTELNKVASHYETINLRVKETFETTARKHEDYEKGK